MFRLRLSVLWLVLAAVPSSAASLAVSNAASYRAALAQQSIAVGFDTDLAVASGGATTVTVQDSSGIARDINPLVTPRLCLRRSLCNCHPAIKGPKLA